MSVRVLLACSGCDAEVTTEPLRQEFKPVFGGGLCVRVIATDVEDVIPEGWMPWDPYTLLTYCPECWTAIERPAAGVASSEEERTS